MISVPPDVVNYNLGLGAAKPPPFVAEEGFILPPDCRLCPSCGWPCHGKLIRRGQCFRCDPDRKGGLLKAFTKKPIRSERVLALIGLAAAVTWLVWLCCR